MPPREELESLTVDELRDLAADAEIEGRSSLNKDGLIDALADDGGTTPTAPAAPEQVSHQEAVNEGRTGIDERLLEVKQARREAEADVRAARPGDRTVDVVGADTFAAAREATRAAEAQSRDVREGPPEG